MYTAGNLHLNVIAEVWSTEVEEALEPFVYELVGMSCAFPSHSFMLILTAQ